MKQEGRYCIWENEAVVEGNALVGAALEGSITVEAAVVLPLYMLAVIAIISLMEMIKCYQDVEVNLYKSAKELAFYSAGKDIADELLKDNSWDEGDGASPNKNGQSGNNSDDSVLGDVALTVLADYYTDNNMTDYLENDNQATDVIVGGSGGISLLNSSVNFRDDEKKTKGGIIDLVATYEMEPLCNIFGVSPYKLINRARVHAWTGYEGSGSEREEDSERIVYVTENGEVFHLSRSCTHIALSISEVTRNDVGDKRNSGGGKYSMCEKCGLSDMEGDSLFITSDGDRYHTSLSCSGLKRTVNAIPISEVGERSACSRCGQ